MFSRRWILNYVLLVLVIIFTYIGNRFGVTTGYQPEQGISRLKPADIDTLGIQTADTLLTLQRDAQGWLFETPIRWPANSINIGRLLSILNSQTGSRLPAEEINLASLGLQFPKAVLHLNDTELLFGGTNNIGERRYVMIDSTVYLLPDQHLPFFAQGLTGLVDRRLLPGRFAMSSLKLPEFEISLTTTGNWQSNNAAGFEQDQIDRLVENWQVLEASTIKSFNNSATPRQKVEISLQDGRRLEFFVISIDPEVVIAHPQIGLQYHFPANLYYHLISLRRNETSS